MCAEDLQFTEERHEVRNTLRGPKSEIPDGARAQDGKLWAALCRLEPGPAHAWRKSATFKEGSGDLKTHASILPQVQCPEGNGELKRVQVRRVSRVTSTIQGLQNQGSAVQGAEVVTQCHCSQCRVQHRM